LALPKGGLILKWLYRKDLQFVDRIFYQVIDNRIAEQKSGITNPNRKPDILDMLLIPNEDNELLSREEIRNHLFIFFSAGVGGAASVMSYVIYELCRNPEIKQNVIEEIDSLMGPPIGSVVAPTPNQVEQMTYLHMVIEEALRMYPPTSGAARIITEDFECGGYKFPKGVEIVSSPFVIQRDPEFYSNPDKFDPERFSKTNAKERGRFEYLPFSAGPRICIGKNFFYEEAKIVIATLLHEVDFELDSSKPQNGLFDDYHPTLKPFGVWAIPKKRVFS